MTIATSFKATGCLDLSFDVDCGPDNDKTVSFFKKVSLPCKFYGIILSQCDQTSDNEACC